MERELQKLVKRARSSSSRRKSPSNEIRNCVDRNVCHVRLQLQVSVVCQENDVTFDDAKIVATLVHVFGGRQVDANVENDVVVVLAVDERILLGRDVE